MSFRRFSPDAPRLCMYAGSSLIIASYWEGAFSPAFGRLRMCSSNYPIFALGSINASQRWAQSIHLNILGCKSESGGRKPTELHLCHPKSIQVLIAGMVSSAPDTTTWPELKMMARLQLCELNRTEEVALTWSGGYTGGFPADGGLHTARISVSLGKDVPGI